MRAANRRHPRRVGGILYKPVELLEDEWVSRSDTAYHWRGRWTSSLGKLYLTNLRLIYSGMPLMTVGLVAIPWAREFLALYLDDVQYVGRLTQVWPEYVRHGISSDAFFVECKGEKQYFSVAFGGNPPWLQNLSRPLPQKDPGRGDA